MGGIVRNKQGILGAKRLLTCQVLLTAVVSILIVAMYGLSAGKSAALGGLVSIIPNAYFAWVVFRFQGAKSARKIVNSLYKGEAVKLLLTFVLFGLVFAYVPIKPLAFFLTYIVVQMVYWFAPLIFDNK
jgi:ATP synthase protein I